MLIDNELQTNPPEGAWYKDIYVLWLLFFAYPFHAVILTNNYDVSQKRSWYASWWATSSCFLILFVSVLSLRTFFFESFSIPAGSMSTTLDPHDQLVVTKSGFGNYRYLGVQLLKTSYGPYLKKHIQFSKKRSWLRHDEHYHVDFDIPCKELK